MLPCQDRESRAEGQQPRNPVACQDWETELLDPLPITGHTSAVEQPPEDTGSPPEPPSNAGDTPPSSNDAVMLVLGALLVLTSFIAWYRVGFIIPGVRENVVTYNGWRTGFFGWASVLIATAAATFAGMRMAGMQMKMRTTVGSLYLLTGVLVFLFITLRFLVKPGLPIVLSQFVKVTRGFGMYVALALAIGMLVTGLRAFQAERRR